MILLTRLNGAEFALNPDLIERADSTPDTVLTLTDGTKYVVAESIAELTALVRDFRASVLARAHSMEASHAYDVEADADHNHDNRPGPARGADNAGNADSANVRLLRPLRGL